MKKYSIFLFISILLNIAVLTVLKIFFTPEKALALLFWGYIFCGLGSLMFGNVKFPRNKFSWVPLTLWAACVGNVLVLFCSVERKIGVSDVITAQSIAPALGLFLSLDFFKEVGAWRLKLFNLSPILILISLVFIKFDFSLNLDSHGFLGILFLFVIAQTMVRVMARGLESNQIFSYGSLLISITIFLTGPREVLFSLDLMGGALLLGVVLYFIQQGYILGLKNIKPSISNSIISASVPVSFIIGFSAHSFLVLGTSVFYLVAVIFVNYAASSFGLHLNSKISDQEKIEA